jgi:hypothetical protein
MIWTYLTTGALFGFMASHQDLIEKDELPYDNLKRIVIFFIMLFFWLPIFGLEAIGLLFLEFTKKEKESV